MKKSLKIILAVILAIVILTTTFLFGAFTGASITGLRSILPSQTSGQAGNELDYNRIENKLDKLKQIIDSNYLYDYDAQKMEDGIYKGYVAGLEDTYSQYYNADEYKALNEDQEGQFGGVGIEVSSANGQYIEVVAPIKGTPAERAGIRSGDRIIEINGESFTADQMQDAVKVMRGEPGQSVNLKVLRTVGNTDEQIDFEIVREIINVESIHSSMLEDKIGYIQITNFQAHTAEDFIKAYEDLKSKGAEKIVLDLRNNPGGLLDVTIQIADYLLEEGPVMQVKFKDGTDDSYNSKAGSEKLPMVTLINSGSASASEVLSGGLKDYNRSEIVGETSFGKGVVQQVIPLADGDGVKVTIAEFFTPHGNKIHGEGIKPTKEVALNENVTTIGPENLSEDNQLQEAIKLLK